MPTPQADATKNADPCPHSDGFSHAPFCAACLVLIPELHFAEKGSVPHGHPEPGSQPLFIGDGPAPPLPPPRA